MHRPPANVLVMSIVGLSAGFLVNGPAWSQQETGSSRGPQMARFGHEDPPERPEDTIRLATYNVLNLFDHVDDPDLEGEYDDLAMAVNDDRCRALASAIRRVDADVLALQEIESLEALEWFKDTYLSGLGYDHVASVDVGYYRGVECSILSRFPITNVRTEPDLDLDQFKRVGQGWAAKPEEGARFQRSPIIVDITTPCGYGMTVFSLHHKSGRSNGPRREAEALGIISMARRLLQEDPDRNIFIMGDFNAAPWDKSFRAYLENGFFDAQSFRTTYKPNPESTLYKTHESDRVLDYILMSGAAASDVVPGSATIMGTLHPGDEYNWRTDEPPSGYASDHYPLMIDIVPDTKGP
ncbi:MAG: hypothetical protein CMJ32_07105 [Phycisphaerae bacterium]|nr:hypothetical protein [Phycisphaerae bacterium]